ncbi:MAG: sigma-70 family RNA polymerase sigma factor [Planctomycetes bacterium]|nr:sigma-70 family RNA polymerase sigma factor [Planctomycetota bacterium]
MEHDEFSKWLVLAKQGDTTALGKLLEAIEGNMREASKARLGERLRGKLRTSDVLQTTFVDVVKNIQDFRGEDAETFAAWVRRVLENNIRDKARFFGRERRRDETDAAVPEADDFDPGGTPLDDNTPSNKVADVEHLHIIGKAMESLEDDYRTVITLRMIECLDHAVIADRMGRSEGAIRMLYSRARAALAVRFNQLLHRS